MAETVQELRKLLRITRRASKKNGTYVDSFGYDYCISSSPMYTDLVQDCVASVLLSTPCCALIHRFWEQGSSRQSPSEYLPQIVEELKCRTAARISAVIIGGNHHHVALLEEEFSKMDIPVVAEYVDGLYPKMPLEYYDFIDNAKEVMAIPLEQRVIMSGELCGYRQLLPR